jgi:osmotically-inducible protein OsmY
MKRKLQRSTIAVLCAALGLSLMTGCDQRNSHETVGQALDRTTEKLKVGAKEASNETRDVLQDAALTAKVKSAIFAEPGLKTLQINVDTKDAVATLAGSVDSEKDRQRATQTAGAVAGVRQVEDKLQVKS